MTMRRVLILFSTNFHPSVDDLNDLLEYIHAVNICFDHIW